MIKFPYRYWKQMFSPLTRRLILGGVFLGIGVLLFQHSDPESPLKTLENAQNAENLLQPQLNTLTAKGEVLCVEAHHMTRRANKQYHFVAPKAYLRKNHTETLRVQALEGLYTPKYIQLIGKVEAQAHPNLTVHTQQAFLFPDAAYLYTATPVEGTGPFGAFSAQRLWLWKDRLVLEGRAHMVLSNVDDAVLAP